MQNPKVICLQSFLQVKKNVLKFVIIVYQKLEQLQSRYEDSAGSKSDLSIKRTTM